MATARSYREGWLTSLAIDKLGNDSAELFLFRLGLKADKNGVYHGEPELLRAAVYPLQLSRRRLADVTRYRDICARAGLLRHWIAEDGRPYVQILKFRQKTPHEKPLFPLPPGEPDESGQEALPLIDDAPPSNRSKGKRGENRPARPPADGCALTQTPNPQTAGESQDDWIARLRTSWPGVDITIELLKAERAQRLKCKNLERVWFERQWLPQCSPAVVLNGTHAKPIEPEPAGWRAWLESEYPDSAYAKGGRDEGCEWHELPADVRKKFAAEMKPVSGPA